MAQLARWKDLFQARAVQVSEDGRTEVSGDAARIAELEWLIG